MHGCLLFLRIPIPIHGDCSIPIPIPNTHRYGYTIISIPISNTRYVTDSYRLSIDTTMKIWLISTRPISISPVTVPIPILIHTDTDIFISYRYQVQVSVYRLMPGIGQTFPGSIYLVSLSTSSKPIFLIGLYSNSLKTKRNVYLLYKFISWSLYDIVYLRISLYTIFLT